MQLTCKLYNNKFAIVITLQIYVLVTEGAREDKILQCRFNIYVCMCVCLKVRCVHYLEFQMQLQKQLLFSDRFNFIGQHSHCLPQTDGIGFGSVLQGILKGLFQTCMTLFLLKTFFFASFH